MEKPLSKASRDALAAITGKRARIVVDHILAHGSITTDDLRKRYGYDHPPRAIRDVLDQGISLTMTMVRNDQGRRMAQYRFGELDRLAPGRRAGRATFSKTFKEELVAAHEARCALCNVQLEARYLQIDHRVPYLVAGDGVEPSRDIGDYMLVCGSCNRAKSWSCEHCPNGAGTKEPTVCATCYWASPHRYSHVATSDIRRIDVTWLGDEVRDHDAALARAGAGGDSMSKFVKDAVRRAVNDAPQGHR